MLAPLLAAIQLCLATPYALAQPSQINYQRSLLIMQDAIVAPHLDTAHPCATDPASPDWTLAALMGGIAGDSTKAAVSVLAWLKLFGQSQVVPNGLSAAQARGRQPTSSSPGPPRSTMKRTFHSDCWRSSTGWTCGIPLCWPAKNAGEFHFIFGAIDLANNCAPLPMTAILEYGVRVNSLACSSKWPATG